MRKNYEKAPSYSANNMITGNSVDVVVNKCDSEIKADIVVSEFSSIRIWGQIKNCYGQPIPNALIKLVKVIKICNGYKYEGVAHTISDCNGFYQFDICDNSHCNHYKILVGKSVSGPERIIIDNNCNPCCDKYTPSSEPIYTETNQSCSDYYDKYDCCSSFDCYDCSGTDEYIPYK